MQTGHVDAAQLRISAIAKKPNAKVAANHFGSCASHDGRSDDGPQS
jgi:hypothetical protein